jgi:serine/threonine protein kinase
LPEERARKISEQLACALYYLHSYGIMHRDIKLENIMMTDNSEESVPKLVDFGLSKIIGPQETAVDPFGTVGYAAPEILRKQPYSKSVDIWSLGVIVYILISGKQPFTGKDQQDVMRQTVYDPVNFTDPKWLFISNSARLLIKSMLMKNPEERISLEEVLQSEWINSNGIKGQ